MPRKLQPDTLRDSVLNFTGAVRDDLLIGGGVNIAGDAVPLRKGSGIASWGTEPVLRNAENIDVYIIQTGAMNTATLYSFKPLEWSSIQGGGISYARKITA